MEIIDPKAVGGRIKDLRLAQGISKKELAESLGVSVEQVERWEAGKDLTLAVLRAISKVLGISVATLFVDVPRGNTFWDVTTAVALADSIGFNTGILESIPRVVLSRLPNDPSVLKDLMASRIAEHGVLVSVEAVRLASHLMQISRGLRYIWVVSETEGKPFSLIHERGWIVDETARAIKRRAGVIAGVTAFIF